MAPAKKAMPKKNASITTSAKGKATVTKTTVKGATKKATKAAKPYKQGMPGNGGVC